MSVLQRLPWHGGQSSKSPRVNAALAVEEMEDRCLLDTAGAIEFDRASYTYSHNALSATFYLHRVGGTSGSIWVVWTPISESAQLGSDFSIPIGSTNTVTFADGETQKTVTAIRILSETGPLPNRTFTVEIKNNFYGQWLGPQRTAQITLVSEQGSQRFLQQAYPDILNRPLDAGGQTGWTNALVSGMPRSAVALNLYVSQEAATGTIENAYQAILHRSADPMGLDYWAPRFASDPYALENLQISLYSSDEFLSRVYGTNAGYLSAVYADVLGREIESGGLIGWQNALNGGASRATIASAILRSGEGATRWVQLCYRETLRREADAGGQSTFVTLLQQGLPFRQVMAELAGSDEFYNACLSGVWPVRPHTMAGSLDPSFGGGGAVVTPFPGAVSQAYASAVQSDGKFVVAGGVAHKFGLARYLPNGTLDTSFGSGGVLATSFEDGGIDRAIAVVIQSDGKIIAGGWCSGTSGGIGYTDFALARYLPDGTLDATYGVGGKVTTHFPPSYIYNGSSAKIVQMVIQSDNKIVVSGVLSNTTASSCLLRYNTNGSLDAAFGVAGQVANPPGTVLTLQPDGKILVGGFYTTGVYNPDGSGIRGDDFHVVARYLNNGTLDATFGPYGLTPGIVQINGYGGGSRQLIALADGRIISAGSTMIRLQANGVQDTSFGAAAGSTSIFPRAVDDASVRVVLDSDGRFVVAAYDKTDQTLAERGVVLARFSSNGIADATFGGATGFILTRNTVYPGGLNALADGKILVAGTVNFGTGTESFQVSRYLGRSDNQQFVVHLFQDLLGREPDAGGLAALSMQLDNGISRGTIVYAIEHSAERLTRKVQAAYSSILGRTADPGGLNAWVQHLAMGGTLEQMKAEFYGSGEYFNKVGGTNAAFVDALYQSILGRGPDPGGATDWQQLLTHGLSRTAAAGALLHSAESDSLEARALYVALLHTTPSETRVNALAQAMQMGETNEVATFSVAAIDEYFRRS